MERIENRKLKAPVGSVLMCLYGVIFLIIEIISIAKLTKADSIAAATVTADVFSVLGGLVLIALSVFSLLRRNAAAMVCSAVFLLYEMYVLAKYIVDGSVWFSAAYAFNALADVALLLVFCIQALPSLASMRKPGGYWKFLPFALRLAGAGLGCVALVLSDYDTFVSQDTGSQLTSGLLLWLPSFLLFVLLAVAVFFVADRAVAPYSEKQNADRGGEAPYGEQPAYGQQPMTSTMGNRPGYPAQPAYAQPGPYVQPGQSAQPVQYAQPGQPAQPGPFAQAAPGVPFGSNNAFSEDSQSSPTVVLLPDQKAGTAAAAPQNTEPAVPQGYPAQNAAPAAPSYDAPAAPQGGVPFAPQGYPAQNAAPAAAPDYGAPAAPQGGVPFAPQRYPAQNAAPAAAPDYGAPAAPQGGVPFAPQGYPAQNAAPAATSYDAPAAPQGGVPFAPQGYPVQNAAPAAPSYTAPAAPQGGEPFAPQGYPAQNAAPAAPSYDAPAAPAQSGEENIAIMHKRYRTLLDAGLISQEKYDEKIKQLMGG